LKELWTLEVIDRNEQKKQVHCLIIQSEAITYYNNSSKWPPPSLRQVLTLFQRLVTLQSMAPPFMICTVAMKSSLRAKFARYDAF
jgi:hypothetical protein